MQGVSINQFAMYAFAKELGELESSRYFTNLLRSKNRQDVFAKFDAVMNKIEEQACSSLGPNAASKSEVTPNKSLE